MRWPWTPQGGIISPTLANMTLDGLQVILAGKYHKKSVNRTATCYPKVHPVRYADDFIITGRTKEGRGVSARYFTGIKNRNQCFAANFKKKGKDDRIVLKRLYDTKIIRYAKVKAASSPFNPEWKTYFKKRKEYKMLKNLNDTKPLLYLWKKQKGICPLCGKPIDINDSWGTTEKQTTPEKQNYLVHESCRRKNN